MRINKWLWIAAMLVLWAAVVSAQETSIDLRRDGRVVADTRKDFLLRKIKNNRGWVSDRLRNKLLQSPVIAVVVPPGKTNGQFALGIVIGSETLPEDFSVDQDDFDKLREYATNRNLGRIESQFQMLNDASVDGNKEAVTQATKAIRGEIDASGGNRQLALLYAGYLVADLDDTQYRVEFADLYENFRATEERAIEPAVRQGIEQKTLAWATPFAFHIHGIDTPKLRDFASQPVSRKVTTPNQQAILTVWHGRSLVVIAEKPGAPFSLLKYQQGLMDYLRSNNPAFAVAGGVDSAGIKAFPIG